VRPALKPGLLTVWRDRDTLQIGIDARRAVALTGMADVAWIVGLLDGSRDRADVVRAAAEGGVPAQAAERVLTLLAAAGVIEDFPAATLRVLPQPVRARLAPELATASLAHGDSDGGARTLARRLAAQVTVHGGGRLRAAIASILRTSGIGHVVLADAAALASTSPASGTTRPDLMVLTGQRPPEFQDALIRGQVPHLAVSASEAIGVVGPLVIPGRSACLRCLDLTRTDHDPSWPLILAQLASRHPDPLGCDAPLVAAVAAQAAFQALAVIDRAAFAQAVTNGTLELVLPGWQWRRRTWPPHPRCCCGSSGGA
jgi:bacteriocin biosynthesis cyclodehydratase domain-containing protein